VSFTQLSLAEAAELVTDKLGKAVKKLCIVEGEIQSGECNTVCINQGITDYGTVEKYQHT
jgi:hypothetical protein